MKGVGLQIEKKNYNGSVSKEFIELSSIKNIILNEYMTPYSVRLTLGVVVKKRDKMVVPFKEFKLRQKNLLKIYGPVKEMLTESE